MRGNWISYVQILHHFTCVELFLGIHNLNLIIENVKQNPNQEHFFFLRVSLKAATGKNYKKALAVLQFKWDLKDMAINAISDHLHQNEKKKIRSIQLVQQEQIENGH